MTLNQSPLARKLFKRLNTLRLSVRASEVALTLVGVAVGLAGGLVVAIMGNLSQFLHAVLFDIAIDRRLSGSTDLNPWAVLFVPALGGALLGLLLWFSNRIRSWPMVDVIEANALHGGRMSMRDSLMLGLQTLLSNGFGASLGLEAGYTQVSAAISSKAGEFLHLRRNDMRVLVGCGAAAAISAAFDAPLAGAFYAFELVIGTYTIAAVAPVMAAALAANLTVHALQSSAAPLNITTFQAVSNGDYIAFIILGLICGFIGIALMRGVTLVESLLRKTGIPPYLRPAVGGLAVGAMGLITPQVLASGHGALHIDMSTQIPIITLVILFFLKSFASAISIGSGFRGGLFFAALFLGAILGKFLAELCLLTFPLLTPDPQTVAVIGMSALTVAVVGGPLTMAFLALETTGDYVITGLALTAAVISSLTVRELFGYSFSTWRLHLRGESIRSAHDVGWVRSLTVGKLMQTNIVTVKASATLNEFRRQYPIGSLQLVIALDDAERYAGLFWVSEAYAEGKTATATRVADVLRQPQLTLLPNANIKTAITLFEKNASDAIAVVDNAESGKVIGLLTEAYALKRYAEELDRAHRSLSGTA
jgi:CIC family chloride channel protein